ncbi:MAG: EAL domain-containing protein [Aliarcobacter sp.]|nr:EAL domain-containing protein [Aliarcobacter sp.]
MNAEKLEETSSFCKTLNLLYVVKDKNNKNNNLEYFENFFKEVVYVDNGLDAFKEFGKNKFSIVITDIEIPELNGFELIKKIKKIKKNIVTIIYSQNDDKESFLKTIELKIDGYLIPPFCENSFLEVLYKSIENCREKKEKINKQKENLRIQKQFTDLVDKNSIISKTDKNGIITYVNENFCKTSEYTKEELIGKSHNLVKHPDNPIEVYKDLWNTIKNKKTEWSGVIKNLSKSGKTYYIKTTIKPILDLNGDILEYVSVRSNVRTIMSDKKHLIDKIESNNLFLLILIQIEDFEILDRFYNILTVDKIEKMFAFNMLSYLPNSYVFENIYNIGNGRYALLADFFDFASSETNISDYLEIFVKNIRKSILIVDEIEYDLNIIVSYSFGKEHLYEDAKCGLDEAINKKMLIKYANDSSIHDHIEAKKNMEVIKMVKIALDNYKIVSYFQPIINNKTRLIEKYESLVRLVDEEGNVLSPYAFLDISKKGSYYNKITHRVLENSFKILEHITTKISINLSSLDIEKEETREKLYSLLEEYKDDTSRIVFELLEDEVVRDFEVIKSFIKRVKKLGVKIAIDDFGAGYSNFERLLDFEPDILKIDGSIVKNIAKDSYSRNVVETIVSFAKKQKIITIAEFVENEEIFNILYDLGVDFSQGYYFGEPKNIAMDKNLF